MASTIQRAHEDERQGKISFDAGGRICARGISSHPRRKARRAGVKLSPPSRGQSAKVRRQAGRDYEKGQHHTNGHVSRRRSRATLEALKREGRRAASPRAISRHTYAAAQRKTSAERSIAAHKATRTKGHARLSVSAHKAARMRMSR